MSDPPHLDGPRYQCPHDEGHDVLLSDKLQRVKQQRDELMAAAKACDPQRHWCDDLNAEHMPDNCKWCSLLRAIAKAEGE